MQANSLTLFLTFCNINKFRRSNEKHNILFCIAIVMYCAEENWFRATTQHSERRIAIIIIIHVHCTLYIVNLQYIQTEHNIICVLYVSLNQYSDIFADIMFRLVYYRYIHIQLSSSSSFSPLYVLLMLFFIQLLLFIICRTVLHCSVCQKKIKKSN